MPADAPHIASPRKRGRPRLPFADMKPASKCQRWCRLAFLHAHMCSIMPPAAIDTLSLLCCSLCDWSQHLTGRQLRQRGDSGRFSGTSGVLVVCLTVVCGPRVADSRVVM